MRKEYIEYMKELPINIYLANIMEYPIHWHDAIEILFVLRGTINLRIETGIYTVEEKEIEIINTNEVHSIKSEEEDNLVLVFNIDPNFFEKYYDDAKDVFFYTNSDIDRVQEGEKYYEFRRYLSILFYEVLSKHHDYKDVVEEQLLEMMYHLLNNFHYLFYEEESLKEDDVQLERYHRIVKYISNNYMNKISLQDLAKREFLTTQYLSYKIKSTFGRSFNDFLNLIRVEESTKLLLDTDKNISEIANEVGFSHVRYFNKHFKLNYKCTPMQYRKKYKVDDEALQKMKKIEYFDLEMALPYLIQYLEEYDRYNYDDKIVKIELDLEKEVEGYLKKPKIIYLGEASNLLEEDNKRILKGVQKDIGFEYGVLDNLFSADMEICHDKKWDFISWNKVEGLINFLKEVGITPIILVDERDEKVLNYFEKYFNQLFGPSEMEKWIIGSKEEIMRQLKLKILEPDSSKLYDRLAMTSYILDNFIKQDTNLVLDLKDKVYEGMDVSNDTFIGGKGIVTSNKLKKPSYYTYQMLSKLGEDILYSGEGYLVTKKDENFQILLYAPLEIKDISLYSNDFFEKGATRKVSINILNMHEDYRITKYELNKRYGSIYDKWIHMGRPARLNRDKLELLDNNVHPDITFYYGNSSTVYNLVTDIKDRGIVLYTFEKVQNESI